MLNKTKTKNHASNIFIKIDSYILWSQRACNVIFHDMSQQSLFQRNITTDEKKNNWEQHKLLPLDEKLG